MGQFRVLCTSVATLLLCLELARPAGGTSITDRPRRPKWPDQYEVGDLVGPAEPHSTVSAPLIMPSGVTHHSCLPAGLLAVLSPLCEAPSICGPYVSITAAVCEVPSSPVKPDSALMQLQLHSLSGHRAWSPAPGTRWRGDHSGDHQHCECCTGHTLRCRIWPDMCSCAAAVLPSACQVHQYCHGHGS